MGEVEEGTSGTPLVGAEPPPYLDSLREVLIDMLILASEDGLRAYRSRIEPGETGADAPRSDEELFGTTWMRRSRPLVTPAMSMAIAAADAALDDELVCSKGPEEEDEEAIEFCPWPWLATRPPEEPPNEPLIVVQ